MKISTIWIDADACPRVIKEILFRASARTKIPIVMVANKPLHTPPSPLISSVVVPGGYDVADRYIADNLLPGDLVITADIPLASDVIKNGGFALNPRGEMYTAENIEQRLSLRNFMENLRNSGVETGGPKELGKTDRQVFANRLDSFLRERSEHE